MTEKWVAAAAFTVTVRVAVGEQRRGDGERLEAGPGQGLGVREGVRAGVGGGEGVGGRLAELPGLALGEPDGPHEVRHDVAVGVDRGDGHGEGGPAVTTSGELMTRPTAPPRSEASLAALVRTVTLEAPGS